VNHIGPVTCICRLRCTHSAPLTPLAAAAAAAGLQVQKQSIPVLLAGQDALVRSPTGSGKTLAYLAPMVHSLSEQQPRINRADGTYAVVLVPTRELAVQVCVLNSPAI
jgi:superfamily II DNA/RNA helicase